MATFPNFKQHGLGILCLMIFSINFMVFSSYTNHELSIKFEEAYLEMMDPLSETKCPFAPRHSVEVVNFKCDVYFVVYFIHMYEENPAKNPIPKCKNQIKTRLLVTKVYKGFPDKMLFKFDDFFNDVHDNPIKLYFESDAGISTWLQIQIIAYNHPPIGKFIEPRALLFGKKKQYNLETGKTIRFSLEFLKSPISYLNGTIRLNPTKTCTEVQSACGGQYSCKDDKKVCHKHYFGDNCDHFCKASNSSDDGFYKCGPHGRRICAKNFYGEYCDRFCQDTNTVRTSYKCSDQGEKICEDGFFFTNEGDCINKCAHDKLCKNGGKCLDRYLGDRECECRVGWQGHDCSKARCDEDFCNFAGSCHISENKARCTCKHGYHGERCGDLCSTEVDSPYRCLHHGICRNRIGAGRECFCHPGFSGRFCEIPKYVKHNHPLTFIFYIAIGLVIAHVGGCFVVGIMLGPQMVRDC